MKVLVALLLITFLCEALSLTTSTATSATQAFTVQKDNNVDVSTESSKISSSSSATKGPYTTGISPASVQSNKTPIDERVTSKSKSDDDILLMKSLLSPKNMLLQEINTLDEETSNAKMQDEVAQTLKAEAKRIRPSEPVTTTKLPATKADFITTTKDSATNKLFEGEDTPYEGDLSENEEDEGDDEYDDDDEDDEENDDEPEDDEQVMTQCPDYCRCAGEYAAATTATCTKLVDEQSFGTGIVHLRIENAGQIYLGPHAFASRGLQQLESITITDTRIVELNQTAFDDIPYLFCVNLTRNDLQEIHPNTFHSNKQLSLLAISGNPLKHTQDAKLSKHGLFDAPSITELDFSYNGLTKLKRTAFSRMPSLTYIILKGNKLKEIDSSAFNTLESLMEVDFSNNLLNEIPVDLLYNSGIQTFKVAGNNLQTLSTIKMKKLRVLDASNNKIKIIGKDDLMDVPLLDQLIINSNGLKRIHQHAFDNLDQLTHLDVSNNKLTSWSEHHLRTNSRLQELLMSDNPELKTLPVFKTVGLEYNSYSVSRFDCANCGLYFLEETTFNAMPAITRLNLSRNRLTGLPNGLLSRLLSLRILDLSDNIIKSLDNNMFRGAISLTKISLAGNPLVTLQVTPFLVAPGLTKLDVSRCALERVWSEARVPLTSLRSLSVRENLLRRITVEELKATPKIVSLDLAHNPLDCDVEFNEAVQWLTDHGVTPVETSRYISNYGNDDNYQDSDGISQWTDLAKIVCDGINDGPPERPVPRKEKKVKIIVEGLDTAEYSDTLLRNNFENDDDLVKMHVDHGLKPNEEVEKAWTTQDQEYEDFVPAEDTEYRPWYSTTDVWAIATIIITTLLMVLLTVHVAIYLAKRRGHGPVIRPPMILRQGLIDNKNCGLVYKPLQEEITTPHVPKRGSFYSSSTFHYDKIVPESV
ncbi:leucine-rich repeat-containing G-protein coupled receptor 6-like isoform X1 [Osmia bicornis bicornis]|uniref:leucine-rich repeat-containing G-protein coupled receptor 6-like isoform X1 n=1 Tax=Osmia bicornis bicornis TaxID=1437191 RepID=UPI0010F5ABE4|nr:leucine-rich repeat-containing G-protein coupled receptor 6-like isoform X1 [Osmia bicornis bicornis]